MSIFRNFTFWIGFLAGAIFWWAAGIIKARLPGIIKAVQNYYQSTRQSLTAGVEVRFRNDMLHVAQRSHLASSLFALDEIIVAPRILAPPVAISPGSPPSLEEDTIDILPYTPDWPELATAYHTPSLSLPEALSGGANLILTGIPGSGKTVSLAYLTTLIARHDPAAKSLDQYLPIFIHACDISFPKTSQDLLLPIQEALSKDVSILIQPRLANMLHAVFDQGRALVLLDGLDEFPPDPLEWLVEYLRGLLNKYPQIRLVIAASPDYYGGLTDLGLIPVALMSWDEEQKAGFLNQWSSLWQQYFSKQTPAGDEQSMLLLKNWLMLPGPGLTPLEITLKVWAGYAGDMSGPGAPDAIESYLLRMTYGISKARPVLEKIASQMLLSLNIAVTMKDIEQWVPDLGPTSIPAFDLSLLEDQNGNPPVDSVPQNEAGEPISLPANGPGLNAAADQDLAAATVETSTETAKEDKPVSPASLTINRVVPDLVNNGLLVNRVGGRISFIHPVIAGYLAGAAIASSGDISTLTDQPDWIGRDLAMQYLCVCNDITEKISPMLDDPEDALSRKLMRVCRWLRDTPKNSRWRTATMRRVAMLINQDGHPFSIRTRLLSAMILSGDTGVTVLLRQMIANPSAKVRLLGALGCGLVHDTKTLNDLVNLINDESFDVQKAALIALGAIGTRSALEAVVDVLQQGSEEMRIIAGEVLSTHAELGHPVLREAVENEDLLVRRAGLFGLARLNVKWANDLIEKVAIEDGQWVVRNAATQLMENIQHGSHQIPRPYPPMTELPWLIAYAGKQGMGVLPGKAGMELLVSVLKQGDDEEKEAALDYLGYHGDINAIPQIYHHYFGSNQKLREAAFLTLLRMAASGMAMPSPRQFGFA